MKSAIKTLVVVCLLMVAFATPVQAVYVTNVQLVFSGGDYIFKDNVFGPEDAGGASAVNLETGAMKVYGASDFEYDIVNATLAVGSQSALNSDDSGTGGVFNPLVAKGSFDSGATMSLVGTIELRGATVGDPGTHVFTGVLLEAYISEDNFEVLERDFPFPANQVKSNHDVVVTGGELYQGNLSKVTDLVLLDFTAAYDLLGCIQQEGAGFGDVEDFADDIVMGGGSRVHFDAVPEPISLSLLGLGSLLLLRKKSYTKS